MSHFICKWYTVKYPNNIPKMSPRWFKEFQIVIFGLSLSSFSYYDKNKKGVIINALQIPTPSIPKSITYFPLAPKNIEIGKSNWNKDPHEHAMKYAFLGYFEGNTKTKKLPKILPIKSKLSRVPKNIYFWQYLKILPQVVIIYSSDL